MKKLTLIAAALIILAGSSTVHKKTQSPVKVVCCPNDCELYCERTKSPPRIRCCDWSLSECLCQ